MKSYLLIYLFALPSFLFGQSNWTIKDIMQFKSIGEVRTSPGGEKTVFSVRENLLKENKGKNLTHLYLYDGENSRQITYGESSSSSPRWFPDGKHLLYISSKGGKQAFWLMDILRGEERLFAEIPTGASDPKWSPDGKWVAYIGETEKNLAPSNPFLGADVSQHELRTSDQLWLLEVSSGKLQQLTSGTFSVGARFGSYFDWSPNSQEIVFSHQPTPLYNDWQKSDLSIVDIKSHKIKSFIKSESAESDPFFSPDGNWVAYRVNEYPQKWIPRGRVYISRIDGSETKKLQTTNDENISILGWSADGKHIIGEEPYRTNYTLVRVPISKGEVKYVDWGENVPGSFNLSLDRQWIGFSLESPHTPDEAFIASLEKIKKNKQISNLQPPIKKPLGKTEVITWNSSDGQEIEGILIYPSSYEEGTKVPLLVYPHGGPAGNSMTTFLGNRSPYSMALLSDAGYAILRPNFRGSEGYGLAFRGANYKDFGGMDYEDVMSGVDEVIKRGVADPEKLGIIGWSYGGYMTSWAISQTDRFKVAINGAGVTNLISFTSLTDMPDYTVGYFGGEFWDITDLLIERSPLYQVSKIKTPVLILHGEQDKRVPISQSYELYNGLKRNKVPVEMYVYPRQPHGIVEPILVGDAMTRVMAWLDRWLEVE